MNNLPLWLPIVTFLIGWGTGVITAWAMYRDHDRRLENTEKHLSHFSEIMQKNTQDIAVLWQRMRGD